MTINSAHVYEDKTMKTCVLALALLAASVAIAAERESPAWATKDLRAGIIGTDNGHR